MVKYTDREIEQLINEEKRFPLKWSEKLNFRQKGQHKEATIYLDGKHNKFSIILRHSLIRENCFSAILSLIPEDSYQSFRLRRYDGSNHQHTNFLEKNTINRKCHIHKATERYQKIGKNEDSYAEETNEYSDLNGALNSLIKDCNCVFSKGQQFTLDNRWF